MKLNILFIAAGCILTACSNQGSETVPLTIHQLDANNFRADIPVSHSGEKADSSYLRQIHRQEIRLKFTSENLCVGAVNVARPTANDYEGENYQLHYAVTCKSS